METPNRHPEQILLSGTLNRMVLLTHIGCGSSCHFPCGPVTQIDGARYVDSRPLWHRTTLLEVNSAALIAVHVFSRSVSIHMSHFICWPNRPWNGLSGDVMYPQAAMLEILSSLETNNSEQLVVFHTWLSQWN